MDGLRTDLRKVFIEKTEHPKVVAVCHLLYVKREVQGNGKETYLMRTRILREWWYVRICLDRTKNVLG